MKTTTTLKIDSSDGNGLRLMYRQALLGKVEDDTEKAKQMERAFFAELEGFAQQAFHMGMRFQATQPDTEELQ